MHELNICLSIVKQLEQQAKQLSAPIQKIQAVTLEIGELAGIEIDALRFSFPIAAKNTIAAQASLQISSLPGQAWCHRCQDHVTIKTLFDACPRCGTHDYRITQGKELRLLNMEVV